MMDVDDRRRELREDIARTEDQLGEAVQRLKEATLRRVDVRTRIAEEPTKWLAVAFVVGLWLGHRTRRRR